MPWTDRAICHGADPELWFPLGYGNEFTAQIDEAKAICDECPIRDDCLNEALTNHLNGIWGGTTDEERRDLRYRRHADAGLSTVTKPCSTCHQDKPLTDYYPDQRASDGRQARCKPCHLGKKAAGTPDEAAHNRAVLEAALTHDDRENELCS
jgi:WhiB family redox-sensing transcriptional regulator